MSSRLFAALLVLALASCKSRSAPHEHDEHEHAASHDTKAQPPAANVLTVEPTMVRDLRITTLAAVSRPAGESVTVLGELGPNEDTYAEVSSPIPARVVQLLASPGDAVKAGQAL
ncbi:MAG TPA: hypothetical protein VK524_13665, partial [Polyangiaceae bacterium]|nr:hypothetical protein [Polyangiaceae bacterium]